MSKAYKDSKIYGCITLNRLVSELGIDLVQPGLEDKLEQILAERRSRVSKEDIKHEIRSNHFMTNKVIEQLEAEGLIAVTQIDGRYEIAITRAGVLYARRYNEFYLRIYEEQIRDHYRYRGLPHWAKLGGK